MKRQNRLSRIGSVLSVLLATSVFLSACSGAAANSGASAASNAPASSAQSKPVTVKIGTTSDEPRVWNAVQAELDSESANIKIETINLTGGEPNKALAEGEVDLNAFQHYAYFNKNKEELKLNLTAIGDTLIVPLNLFSKKHKSLEELPNGAQIAIPDDPTNQGRALNVLKNAGLIKLDEKAGNNALIKDVTENPKNIKFVEITGAQLPRSLQDVDAAIINCGYAVDSGLDPVKDPIYKDDIDLKNPEQQPFINLIAARTADKDNPAYLKIVEAYHTQRVADAIAEVYSNAAVPAFEVK
ncbi:MetQ/NlpA family ABC transporter substrate-binding protein [Faecalispora jeddahensis]|uniref:MetQ/NlpA family ABC transporter substrate-binding protein n=1 Tax=Faecalispora jeddahensis TaxID=1414721 RepID=UPI001897B977|nr:MetQ/NlpA family ABC transporter substrate-binding protein [Faecalispora jeddahensis]